MQRDINLTIQDPRFLNSQTIEITNRVHIKNLQTNRSSRWFYIPQEYVTNLRLVKGMSVFFYVIEKTYLIMAFTAPKGITYFTRKVIMPGNKPAVVVPRFLVDNEILDKATRVQLIHIEGGPTNEVQLRLL